MSPGIACERVLHHVRRNIAAREGRVGRLLRQSSIPLRTLMPYQSMSPETLDCDFSGPLMSQ